MKNIKFIRADNSFSGNAIFQNYDKNTGEMIFYELIGGSMENPKPKLLLHGKEPYKRLFIQRVFPVIEV